MARLNANGTLDTSFGSGGETTIGYGYSDASGLAVSYRHRQSLMRAVRS